MTKEKSFMEEVLEEFGDSVFTVSTDVKDVVSTGSLALDVSTGVGGLPKGRFVEIFGLESSGKTSLALSVAKEDIAKGGKVMYLDVEQTLDDFLARSILEEYYLPEKFVVARPETAEMAYTLAEKAIQSKEFSTIIFDSLGAVSPEKELEDDFGDSHVALIARLNTPFLRRNAFAVRTNNILFIFINQVRDKIGDFIKSYDTPGGHAVKHYSSLRISLFPGKFIKVETGKKIDGKKEEIKVGQKIMFTIIKNKVGLPHRSATYPLIWGKGIDYIKDVLDFADKLGVISGRGPYKVFNEETLGLGEAKTIERLYADKELLDRVVEMCYNTAGVRPIKKEEG